MTNLQDSYQVLVTRPEPFAKELASKLEDVGFQTSTCPLISFIPDPQVTNSERLKLLKQHSIWIFISQQAVNYLFETLETKQVAQLQPRLIIAVGPASQQALQKYGLQALSAEPSNSEGILQLLTEQGTEQDSVLLIRGNKGRQLLAEQVPNSFAFQELMVYQRQAVAQTLMPLSSPHKALVVTSSQLLMLSTQLLNSAKYSTSDFAIICPSSRIRQQAQQMGYTNCYMAASASHQHIQQACIEWRTDSQSQLATPNNNIINLERPNMSDQDTDLNETNKNQNLTTESDFEQVTPLDSDSSNDTPTTEKKSSGLFSKLFWLLIILALGYAAYWVWQQWQQVEQTDQQANQVAAIEQQIQSQQQQFQLLQQQNKQTTEQAQRVENELRNKLELMQQQLVTSQRKFQALSQQTSQQTNSSNSQQQEWMLAEAEYLIRQAAQKLHYSDDSQSIVALLEAADQQVLAMADSNLINLRAALTNDIANIRATGTIDIDGILVKIDSLQQQVGQLELASVQLDNVVIKETTTTELEPSAWQNFKNNAGQVFSQYYKVHHYDEAVKPFISPQQNDYLRQNIRLNLKLAQLSALRHKQAAYQNYLQEVANWSKEYFKRENSVSQAFTNQLSQLLRQSVSLKLPTKLESLSIIKKVNNQRLQQWLSKPSPLEKPQQEQASTEDTSQAESEQEFPEPEEDGNITEKIEQSLQRLQSSSDEPKEGDQQ